MDLDQRIQALAQELQDTIFDHVIALEPGVMRPHEPGYKLPVDLQLNHALRTATAKKYYGKQHVFHFKYLQHVEDWLGTLTADHQSLIRRVSLNIDISTEAGRPVTTCTHPGGVHIRWFRNATRDELKNAALRVVWCSATNPEALQVEYYFPVGDDERWMEGDDF